jgi:EAL domain-containing protein (putative c-di-GMP-specific phosphodiesterase class I)
MAYQPIVDLCTGRVRGVEALARFVDSSRTTTQWFDDAARVERTSELELLTARAALSESADWPGDLWLNLSASVLLSPAVGGLLEGRDLSRVVVEVSEHEEVADYAGVRLALAPWRERGLRLAVDDAGAGFSSLRHVLELAPDIIKLDISLVQNLSSDASRRALVTALVAFAAEAGAVVVAEGVETEEELLALRGSGVSLGQGYHLGRALPADEHVQTLEELPPPRSPLDDGVRV